MNTRVAKPFIGVHCETVATGTLLEAVGYRLSEPMLFGLGEGLAFVLLNLSSLPLPFVGGRSKPFALTRALCSNLGLGCHAEETASKAKSWTRLAAHLDAGRAVGLQLDCFYLPYFERAPHFAGHFVAATRLLGDDVEVVDTKPQGTVQRVHRSDLEAARHARGPMSANALLYTVEAGPTKALSEAASAAMVRNAKTYLAPAFGGSGALGIAKLARSLPTWLDKAKSPRGDLLLAADLMERAGTGGALFRNLYRDFLREAGEYVAPARAKAVREAHSAMTRAAEMWTRIAALLAQVAVDGRAEHLREAAQLCGSIVDAEQAAMLALVDLP